MPRVSTAIPVGSPKIADVPVPSANEPNPANVVVTPEIFKRNVSKESV